MNIAVVGAGVAGLALAHFLQKYGQEVTVFDSKGAGGGASGVSTGLLHPFPGRIALRSWQSKEGMEASLALIEHAERSLGSPVAERTGILRIAVNERQVRDFKKRAAEDEEAIWWEVDQVLAKVSEATAGPGLWVPSGITVYSHLYLKGLSQGIRIERQAIGSLDELKSYDQVVLATGSETLHFPECAHLPLEPTKGHTLLCKWPGERLPFSLVSMGHITPTENPELCQIGSTYEHNFNGLEPDSRAVRELLEKAAVFYPPARDFEVVELRAGVRISPKEGYRPIIEQLGPRLWVFTGLGSRGMLYHALLGERLAKTLIKIS